ncbi:MAG: patatin-like phospholipase family protein [Acidobacteria bacterium]|nr:patatin-like phospholipase family protein [Acidobacteriota bacterium]
MAMNREGAHSSLPPTPLGGARIWLSGAVPETEGITEAQGAAIRDFVRRFARRVFERGGYIVHGSHPSFTPILLEEAALHQQQGGHKDRLILAVSRLWSNDQTKVPIDEWRRTALVYETPKAEGERARDESLAILRKWMVSRSDAIVVIGGKWWQAVSGRSGVPLELGHAIERGLPCFLLGGLVGAAQDFVKQHPEVLGHLKNGLNEEANREFATRDDVGSLAEEICTQLERLPLVRGNASEGVSFRILALDGGGLKGAFTAAAIATWEKHTGLKAVDHFDLIAGTSTGGILAIGLGLGLSGQQMLNFYRNRGPVIFPITRLRSRLRRNVQHIFRPKYAQEVLLRELESAFYAGNKTVHLKQSRCRLVIPTYHSVAGASHQFRTPHHPDLTADAQTEAAHAALATAAAPTFFSAAKIANMVAESSYFDGGVWANSPGMAAIIEAVCFLRIPLERIDVLSVGTTEEPFTTRWQTRSGILGWLWKKRIIELLMNVQQESSLRLARHLVGDPKFLRVNAMTAPGSYSLDSPKEIGELADLGNRAALVPDVLGQVKSRFLNGVSVAPWERFG